MGKKKAQQQPDNTIARHKRARFDYAILETMEAGLVLTGSEVKSLRAGQVNISESHIIISKDELFLLNAYIAPYEQGAYANHEERRTRKLLVKKSDILKLRQKKEAKGLALVPLKLYWARGKVKLELAVAQGKQKQDKRASIKEREWNIDKQRLFKGR